MDRAVLDRLKWKCRRGLLELDLVLQGFIEKNLQEKDIKPLNDLLELQDNDLWDIVSGRRNGFEPRFEAIVARIRATRVAPLCRAS